MTHRQGRRFTYFLGYGVPFVHVQRILLSVWAKSPLSSSKFWVVGLVFRDGADCSTRAQDTPQMCLHVSGQVFSSGATGARVPKDFSFGVSYKVSYYRVHKWRVFWD